MSVFRPTGDYELLLNKKLQLKYYFSIVKAILLEFHSFLAPYQDAEV